MRQHFRFISVGLSLLIVAGCSDGTAPTDVVSHAVPTSAPSFDTKSFGWFGDQSTSFTVGTNGGTYGVNGMFNVSFPANSICDPDLSSYGPGTWDASCIPLNRSIKITATVRTSLSGVSVDFQPELRFVPTQTVTMYTDVFASFIRSNADFFSRNTWALRPFAVNYISSLNSQSVADYLGDPSLLTHIGLKSGRIWRRIKHFSGYNVTTGASCDAGTSIDCVIVESTL